MKCSRWMAVCVDMLDHPVVGMDAGSPKPANPKKPVQSYAVAWLDLLRSAAWKDHVTNHKGKVIALTRGQFFGARSYWADRWNWGEQAVRSFFARLAEKEMIAISNQSFGHVANVVTICNYDTYQSRRADAQPVEKPEPNQSPTSAQPVPNQTLTKDTKNTTTVLLAPEDQKSLNDRLIAACNGALDNPVNCMGLLNLSIPQMWIRDGADIDLDVIPTLEAAGKKYHGKRIRDWNYFSGMIGDAKAKRLRGMPEPSAPRPQHASYPTPADATARAQEALNRRLSRQHEAANG